MSRITLHGRDHAAPRHVSAWQTDRAYRYQPLGKRILSVATASGEPVWHSLAAGAAVVFAIGAMILLFGVFA